MITEESEEVKSPTHN